jgi:hypothetical protein
VSAAAPAKEARGGGRAIGDIRQWLGMSGDLLGMSGGTGWRAFAYSLLALGTLVGVVNIIDVITILHEEPGYGLLGPIVWEGSSWLSWVAFAWISWIFFRLAPPAVRPRWRLLVHPVGAVVFSLAHVTGFLLLRKFVYWLAGDVYTFGAFWPHFAYELAKDSLGYALTIGGFAVIEQLVLAKAQTRASAAGEAMFAIRDGARIVRVPVKDILAVSSAGNYVEFALQGGRKVLMRSPLSAIEAELAVHGFVRVHRSWIVNAMQMTGLKPEGSGDYTVELGALSVPLSRRFPEALARLRAT